MGKKGKSKKKAAKGGILGGLAGLAGQVAGAAPGAPGGQTGTFRVDRFGNMTKISIKRRRRGFRMPAIVREQIRASNEMMRTLSTALLLRSSQ